jgi:hypothetical protein
MYNYQEIKPRLFSDEGQRLFLKVRDKVNGLLKVAGAFQMQEAIQGFTGSNWEMIACVDRMVELGEIMELLHKQEPLGQYRVFTSTKREL